MQCDLCGKEGVPVSNLVSHYQTDAIKQVCGSCEGKINLHIREVQVMQRKMLHGLIKSFMVNFKDKHFKKG